jgi:GT2 family glycosyltransferase
MMSFQATPDTRTDSAAVTLPAALPTLKLCLVMTCFNRREQTLACLEAVSASTGLANVLLRGVLVDDGSTDGTAEAVRARFPWVTVIEGDGELYWCRGMHRAFEAALLEGHDHYVWLNDDTYPFPDALQRLLTCSDALSSRGVDPVILVGSTVHPITQALSYGGERSSSDLLRLSLRRVHPRNDPQPLDTMNGNLVLINAEAALRVGNLDPAFEHAMGDIDYGLRANALGVGVWLAPGVHGSCGNNCIHGTYRDPALPYLTRWQLLLGRKGLPWRSWLRLSLRHGGAMGPIYFVWPYVRMLVSDLPGLGKRD